MINKRLLPKWCQTYFEATRQLGRDADTVFLCFWTYMLLYADICQNHRIDLQPDSFFPRLVAKFSKKSQIVAYLEICDSLWDELSHVESNLLFSWQVYDVIRRLELPYGKQLAERIASRFDSPPDRTPQSYPHDLEKVMTQVTSLLLYCQRLCLSVERDGIDEWLDIEDNLVDPLSILSRSSDKGDVCTFAGRLNSGSVSDLRGTRGRPGTKARASCTLSPAAWRTATKLDLIPPFGLFYPNRRHVGEPVSRLTTVPKNWKRRRIIVMDPACQAWMQQGVGKTLARCVLQWTRGRSDPMSPELNRYLLWSKDYCTLDLHAASDSVHLNWFQTVPSLQLRQALSCSRTPIVELPDGSYHTLRKFAGMGNGSTFALECFVFSTLVQRIVPKGKDWAVFGDDIIVPDEYYEPMVNELARFGFTVNLDKSFHGAMLFRESCGRFVFHFCGLQLDCAPLRFPGRRIYPRGINPSDLVPLFFGNRSSRPSAVLSLTKLTNRSLDYRLLHRELANACRLAGCHFYDDWPHMDWDFYGEKDPWVYSVTGRSGFPPFDSHPIGPPLRKEVYQVGSTDRYPFSLLCRYDEPTPQNGWFAYDPKDPWLRETRGPTPFQRKVDWRALRPR